MNEPKGGRGFLLHLAAEAIAPVIGKCAEKHIIQVAGLCGGAVAGPAGAAVGVAAGFVVERAINYFGPPIVNCWLAWLRGKPKQAQIAAIAQLGTMSPEDSRREATAAVEQAAPAASDADKAVAIEYLTAISSNVRRSLVTDRSGATTLPSTMLPDSEQTLLRLLPTDVPPYAPGSQMKGTPYRLGNLLGTGGFGAVYRATDRFNQHLPMAIKFCLDPNMLDMLKTEEKNLKQLIEAGGQEWSSRIVRLYGSNFKYPTPYLVYEYIEGGDLAAYLSRIYHERGRGLAPDAAFKGVRQIAEALAFAHEHGLVHRDLKPANVLVSGESIKLADFGIGTVVAKHAIKNSRIGTSAVNQLSLADRVSLYRGAGTPLYMSPEQRRGESAVPHHDLYSLGVMWYQLLVGDVTREFAQGWDDELAEEFSVPKEHIEYIRLCTGRPSKRPANARELLKHLWPIASPPSPAPPPKWERVDEGSKIQESLPAGDHVNERMAPYRRTALLNELQQILHFHAIPPRPPLVQTRVLLSICLLITLMTLIAGALSIVNWDRAGIIGFYLVATLIVALMLVVLSQWFLNKFDRKKQERYRKSLEERIAKVARLYPEEVRGWYGASALSDPERVRAIIHSLENQDQKSA